MFKTIVLLCHMTGPCDLDHHVVKLDGPMSPSPIMCGQAAQMIVAAQDPGVVYQKTLCVHYWTKRELDTNGAIVATNE